MLIFPQWLYSVFVGTRVIVRSWIVSFSCDGFARTLPVDCNMCIVAQLHPQLSIWSATALHLDICRHVSLVSPTSRQRLRSSASHRRSTASSSVYCRQASLPSFQRQHTTSNDLPRHVISAPSLAVSRQRLKTFLFSRSYLGIVTWLAFSYCICGPSDLYFSFFIRNMLPEFQCALLL